MSNKLVCFVKLVLNKSGGWSIVLDNQSMGSYATKADAARIARLNGFTLSEAAGEGNP